MLLLAIPLLILTAKSSYTKDYLIRLGLIYQLLGGLTVIANIYYTRALFKSESLKSKLVFWWNSRPKTFDNTQRINASGWDSSNVSANLNVTTVEVTRDKSKSSDANIDRLFEIYNENLKKIDAVYHDLDKKHSDISNVFLKKIEESNKHATQVELNLKDNALGGLQFSFLGSICILIGVTISTIPNSLIATFF